MKSLFHTAANYTVTAQFQRTPVIIYPSAAFEVASPLKTSQAEGHVILVVNKPVTFTEIQIRHVVHYTAKFEGEAAEEGELQESLGDVQTERRTYAIGEHRLPFIITLPCSVATNIVNRKWNAAVHGQLDVILTDPKGAKKVIPVNSRLKYDPLRAVALPAFQIAVTPGQPGELPPPLNCHVQGFLDQIGPYDVGVYSPALTMGAIGKVEFNLVEPPDDILSVTLAIIQSAEFESPKTSIIRALPSHKVEFAGLRGQHGAPLHKSADGPFRLSSVIRFPHDEQIMISTLPGTQSPLRVTHKLAIAMTILSNGREQTATLTRDIVVGSCLCFADSMLLPEYAEQIAKVRSQEEYQPLRLTDPWPCVCGFSVEQLLKQSPLILDTAPNNITESYIDTPNKARQSERTN